jgi:hypothetical protein
VDHEAKLTQPPKRELSNRIGSIAIRTVGFGIAGAAAIAVTAVMAGTPVPASASSWACAAFTFGVALAIEEAFFFHLRRSAARDAEPHEATRLIPRKPKRVARWTR